MEKQNAPLLCPILNKGDKNTKDQSLQEKCKTLISSCHIDPGNCETAINQLVRWNLAEIVC